MRSRALRQFTAMLLPSLLIGASGSARGQAPPAAPAAASPAAKIKVGILEGYPDRVQARLEQRKRSLSAASSPSTGFGLHAILNLTKRWHTGQTLKVAFRGGDKALHKKIADNVLEWTNYANLKFDFGVNPATGNYRTWTPADTAYAADIRVSFDQTGFYSLVGNDSVNAAIARPGEESLNLEGFDQTLPDDWKGVSLHEFGHAIGFEHEHQGPGAPCDFRFDDDPHYVATTDDFGQFIPDSAGRKPGLYTLLGGPPNNWPQAVVDFNLKQLPQSSAFNQGPFDKLSIMKYFFPDYMFVSGKNSPCYTDSENVVISALDKVGAAQVYPRAPEAIAADVTLRTKVLQDINKVQAMPASMKSHYRKALEMLKGK